ncbi:unnamed protein product [Lepidochelys kempii]
MFPLSSPSSVIPGLEPVLWWDTAQHGQVPPAQQSESWDLAGLGGCVTGRRSSRRDKPPKWQWQARRQAARRREPATAHPPTQELEVYALDLPMPGPCDFATLGQPCAEDGREGEGGKSLSVHWVFTLQAGTQTSEQRVHKRIAQDITQYPKNLVLQTRGVQRLKTEKGYMGVGEGERAGSTGPGVRPQGLTIVRKVRPYIKADAYKFTV